VWTFILCLKLFWFDFEFKFGMNSNLCLIWVQIWYGLLIWIWIWFDLSSNLVWTFILNLFDFKIQIWYGFKFWIFRTIDFKYVWFEPLDLYPFGNFYKSVNFDEMRWIWAVGSVGPLIWAFGSRISNLLWFYLILFDLRFKTQLWFVWVSKNYEILAGDLSSWNLNFEIYFGTKWFMNCEKWISKIFHSKNCIKS